MKRILTYGTFDLLHYGHINLLKRAKALGDYLVVAVSTDSFNELKGKKAYHNYETRKMMLEAVRYVDLVIPEENWEQKIDDVKKYDIDIVVMGSDWAGSDRFDYLKDYCEVVYLPRTEGVSTTKIKEELKLQEPQNGINQIPSPNSNT
ncbi:MAG: glycerol-3-phosphate cytidylyltransferase [Clostridia bacterium]|nr:glycerol-3-phosphate cytidylyltransferase [Clostridia bacterium]